MIKLKKSPDKNFIVLNLTDIQLSFEEFNKNHKARRVLDHSEAAYKQGVDLKSLTWEESLSASVWNEGFEDSCGVCRDDFGAPVFEDGVFGLLKELGNTRHVIAGHDHTNNFIINYEGIKLVYATKTGIGCYYDKDINGGTFLEIGNCGVENAYQEMVDITHFFQ